MVVGAGRKGDILIGPSALVPDANKTLVYSRTSVNATRLRCRTIQAGAFPWFTPVPVPVFTHMSRNYPLGMS